MDRCNRFGQITLTALALLCVGCDDKKKAGETGTGTVKQCEKSFVAKRRLDTWYPPARFPNPKGCDPQSKLISETVSIPIYWAVVGKEWKQNETQPLLDAATKWFDRYCIKLDIHAVVLKTGESDQLADRLNNANQQGRDKYRQEIGKVYGTLWEQRMWKPPQFLLILFVDPFREMVYDSAVVNVSGNIKDIPVILVTHADQSSNHIVTHELIHGLGKAITGATPPGSRPFIDSQDDSWSEGGCAEEMGNATRTNPTTPMTKADDAPMDWASYWAYLNDVHNIR